jgi:hypothetical protein
MMMKRGSRRVATAIAGALGLFVIVPGATADERGVVAPGCIQPNIGGTIEYPVQGCGYIAPLGPIVVDVNGLPGTQLHFEPQLVWDPCPPFAPPYCPNPGGAGCETGIRVGSLACGPATMQMSVTGTGQLAGLQRELFVPMETLMQLGPRVPGDPVQQFPSDMLLLQGELFGDPDFCQLQLQGGNDLGLPSPGQTTLTRLGPPGSDFQVDSFFDITYQIEFQGCPGSPLDGMSGAATGQLRLEIPGVDPIGACCSLTGLCVGDFTQLECEELFAGTWLPGESCLAGFSCTQDPLGACCLDGQCIFDGTEVACNDAGGQFFVGETCTNPDFECPIDFGACCLDGQCLFDGPQSECESSNGVFFPGESCSSPTFICPPPDLGVCCWQGVCLDSLIIPDAVLCREIGGEWMPNATCDQVTCTPPLVEQIRLSQIDWFGLNTSTPFSTWGELRIDYIGPPTTYYANLVILNTGLPEPWVLQNMGVDPLFGPGVPQTVCTLVPLTIDPGAPVGSADIIFSLTPFPIQQPGPLIQTVPVPSKPIQFGTEDLIELGSPADLPAKGDSNKTDTPSMSGKLPNITSMPNQPQGANECAPGAISNSLKYLDNTTGSTSGRRASTSRTSAASSAPMRTARRRTGRR